MDRVALGKQAAEYQLQNHMALRVAILGKAPTVNGVGVSVIQNHGLEIELFIDRQRAIEWLADPSSTR